MPATIELAYKNIDAVKTLFAEYARALGVDLSYQDFQAEFEGLPGKYAQPDGRLYIARYDGALAGCAALRPIDNERCEMKRLYVRPEHRGHGIGGMLARQVISDAKEIRYKNMLLDTLPSMERAISIYKNLGFYEIEPYYHSPVKGTVFLCLNLEQL